jgi:hypothetical protein
MSSKPVRQVGVSRESLATGENRAQSSCRAPRQVLMNAPSFAIDIAEKGKIERIRLNGQAVGTNVAGSLVVEDDQSREVQRIELREWNQ